jgi:hypothetical protein
MLLSQRQFRMSTTSEADADSINARLADFICGRQEEIIRAWLARVQADGGIGAESLTTNQLRNHLPRLFDDLADLLRRYASAEAVARTERDAEKHGRERWQQGFRLVELLREVMHLRAVFIYHLRVFEESHAGFGTAALLFAHSTVHEFLDQMAIDATEQFVASDKRARRATAGLSL